MGAGVEEVGLILDKACLCLVQPAHGHHGGLRQLPNPDQGLLNGGSPVPEIRPQGDVDIFQDFDSLMDGHSSRRIKSRIAPLVGALLLVTGCLTGCADEFVPDVDGHVYHWNWQQTTETSRVIQDRMPQVPEAEEQHYREVVERFNSRAPMLFERDDIISQLRHLEQVYMLSGRYLELVALYEADVDRRGVESRVAPALVWAYVQLGQERAARDLVQELIEARPDEASTWVVAGAFHLQRAQTSTEAARNARDAFATALEVEPEFAGFMGFTTNLLTMQVRELSRRIPDEPRVIGEPEVEEEAEEVAEVEEEVEEVEAAEEVAEVEEAEEAEEAPEPPQERASHHVALGQGAMQLGRDHFEEAQQHFQRALRVEPDNLDAAIGLMLVAARSGAPDDLVRDQLDLIADQDHLTARQAYELGLFARRSLNDHTRATSLLERVRQLDPAFAERVGVDALLQ